MSCIVGTQERSIWGVYQLAWSKIKFSIPREKSGSLNTWSDTKSGQEKGKYSYFSQSSICHKVLGTFKPSSPAQFAACRLFTATLVPSDFCPCFSPRLRQYLSQCTQVKSNSDGHRLTSNSRQLKATGQTETVKPGMTKQGKKMFYFQVKIRNRKMSAKLAPSHRMSPFAATGISLTDAFQQEVLDQL